MSDVGPDAARPVVAILAAGRSVRGGTPSAVLDVDGRGRVLDWLLAAFAVLPHPDVRVVAGYKAESVLRRFPAVRVILNPSWSTSGAAHSLMLAMNPADGATFEPTSPAVPSTVYACYGDVVFRPAAVSALAAADPTADAVLAVDTTWRARYDGRGADSLEHAEKARLSHDATAVEAMGVLAEAGPDDPLVAEFAGLLRLSSAAASVAGELPQRGSLPELVAHLLNAGKRVVAVDLAGDWAELDAPQDLARFVLGTKAESLARLSAMDHGGEIGVLVAFTHDEWLGDPDAVQDRIRRTLPVAPLIVRSSALSEDGWTESGAGQHESLLDVAADTDSIAAAVTQVFASYRTKNLENQVLVQAMLTDVRMSGVVMTRTHAVGAPWYVVNFDDRSHRTDTVTGGADARTVFVHRGATELPPQHADLGSVLATVRRIETLVGHDSLDIEFAVTGDAQVHVLQVRPIAVDRAKTNIDDDAILHTLDASAELIKRRSPAPPNLVGATTRYSVMADWNPAEIIGTKPKPLAFSLYRHLITDDVWARQRAEYGYRDVRPCPLLVDLGGHPYVDIRATFSSFIPADLPDSLAVRLVDRATASLAEQPHLHDKVEFDILLTCLTPDFETLTNERLVPFGFDANDITQLADALREITNNGIRRTRGDLDGVADVARRIDLLLARPPTASPPLDRAFLLLDLVRRDATVAFAHLARSAFVATSLLRSLTAVGALPPDEHAQFLASVETVLGRMRTDARRVGAGDLSWSQLVHRYGHLRPGTYDITSPCYATAAELYLGPVVKATRAGERLPDHHETTDQTFRWTRRTAEAITGALGEIGLSLDASAFDLFARSAIAGREEGKFVFTKGLSAALEAIAAWGDTVGLDRNDLAYLQITDILHCRDATIDPDRYLRARADEGRERYLITQGLCFPGQVGSGADLYCFEQEEAEPNFVTQRTAEGSVVVRNLTPDLDVAGRIVLIPNADPGYDWLLARDLGGLVTMFGGANSHMAVRAAELSLPAAIGVGERLFAQIETAHVLRLDCASRTITVVA